jgi:predicted  nucleic acid-binding Zn-ribbon protein
MAEVVRVVEVVPAHLIVDEALAALRARPALDEACLLRLGDAVAELLPSATPDLRSAAPEALQALRGLLKFLASPSRTLTGTPPRCDNTDIWSTCRAWVLQTVHAPTGLDDLHATGLLDDALELLGQNQRLLPRTLDVLVSFMERRGSFVSIAMLRLYCRHRTQSIARTSDDVMLAVALFSELSNVLSLQGNAGIQREHKFACVEVLDVAGQALLCAPAPLLRQPQQFAIVALRVLAACKVAMKTLFEDHDILRQGDIFTRAIKDLLPAMLRLMKRSEPSLAATVSLSIAELNNVYINAWLRKWSLARMHVDLRNMLCVSLDPNNSVGFSGSAGSTGSSAESESSASADVTNNSAQDEVNGDDEVNCEDDTPWRLLSGFSWGGKRPADERLARIMEMIFGIEQLYHAKRAEYESKLASYRAREQTLSQQCNEVDGRIAHIKAELAQRRARHVELADCLTAKMTALDAATATLDRVRKEARDQEAKCRAQERRRTELESKSKALDAKNADLTAENAELAAKNAELTAKNTELKAKKQELDDNCKQIETTSYDLHATREVLNEKNKELNAINKELNAINKELDAKNKELDEKNKELDEKNKELDEKNEELDEKNEELNERNKELDSINEELDATARSKEEELAAMKLHLENLWAQEAKLAGDTVACEKRMEATKSAIARAFSDGWQAAQGVACR